MSKQINTLPRLLSFRPHFKQVLWGGDRIACFKHIDNAPECIGESWEISAMPHLETPVSTPVSIQGTLLSELVNKYGATLVGKSIYEKYGNRFPLLIKFIDAKMPLSLQVHPDEEMAQRRHNLHGKDEAWFVIDANNGASIFCGPDNGGITKDSLERHIADNSIMGQVKEYISRPGQFYYVPSGTLHAIGAGNLLAEIQMSSDITYRVYDYDRIDIHGNRRELHTNLAVEAVTRNPQTDVETHTVTHDSEDFDCSNFVINYRHYDNAESVIFDCAEDSFSIFMVIDGQISIDAGFGETLTLNGGYTAMSPAFINSVKISGTGTLLRIYMRKSS